MKYSKDQHSVILHRNGHALIGACPGGGKTTTLAKFVTALLDDFVNPKHILVLMFNKDASEHFADKLASLTRDMPHVTAVPDVKTYHSLGYSITNAMVQRGFLPDFKLETNGKRQEIIGMNVVRKLTTNEQFKELQNKSSKIVDTFISFIEMTKSMMLPPSEVFEVMGIDKELDFFIKGYDLYEEERKREKVRFFTDLIHDPLMAIKANPSLREWLGNKKAYIICDEFQDSDPMQYELLEIIAGSTANVIACGDIDQSIYTFRGADPELMMHQFQKSFPDPKFYTLNQTFRYGDELAMSANNLITENKNRYDTLCVSNPNNAPTSLDLKLSLNNSGQGVFEIIEELKLNKVKLTDVAILVRLYSVAIPVELALLQNNIPVRMEPGRSCFNTTEFKAMRNLLRIATGEVNEASAPEKRAVYESLLKYPHAGITAEAMEMGLSYAEKENCLMSECLLHIADNAKIHPFVKKKLKERSDTMVLIERQQMKSDNFKMNGWELLSYYERETDLKDGLKYSALTELEMSEILERIKAIMSFMKLNNGKPQAMLDLFYELMDQSKAQSKLEAVTITSVHKAKGLEWDYVLVPGVEVGLWPYEGGNTAPDIESERRLLYVAITRAMKKAFVVVPKERQIINYLSTGSMPNKNTLLPSTASEFVYDMDLFKVKEWMSKPERYENQKLYKTYKEQKQRLIA